MSLDVTEKSLAPPSKPSLIRDPYSSVRSSWSLLQAEQFHLSWSPHTANTPVPLPSLQCSLDCPEYQCSPVLGAQNWTLHSSSAGSREGSSPQAWWWCFPRAAQQVGGILCYQGILVACVLLLMTSCSSWKVWPRCWSRLVQATG